MTRKPIISLIALIAVIVSVSTYLLTRPRGLLADAMSIVTACVTADYGVIEKHIPDHERGINQLDSNKVRAIVEQVIAPNLSSFRIAGRAESAISSGDGTEAYGMIPLKHSSGLDYELYVHTRVGDTVGQTMLTDMLLQVWAARYLCEAGYSTVGGIERTRARIRGLEADMPKLKELGMDYLVDKSISGEPKTLEEALSQWKERLRVEEAKAAAKPQ